MSGGSAFGLERTGSGVVRRAPSSAGRGATPASRSAPAQPIAPADPYAVAGTACGEGSGGMDGSTGCTV